MIASLLPRSKVNPKNTWNAERVVPTHEAWGAELQHHLQDIPNVYKFQGKLGNTPDSLVKAMEVVEELLERAKRVYFYTGFSYSVNTTDQKATAMRGEAQGIMGQVHAATAFVNPELLATGEKKQLEWLKSEPHLDVYSHFRVK